MLKARSDAGNTFAERCHIADGYLSGLQQFLLDVVATLAAILKGPDAGKLTPEQAYAATQSALCLLGIENDHMVQERRKRVLMNVNPALKSTAEEENAFQQIAHEMCTCPYNYKRVISIL